MASYIAVAYTVCGMGDFVRICDNVSVFLVSSAAELPQPRSYAARPLLARLIDNAALFPPDNVSMSAALRDQLNDRASEHAAVQGLFLCPASRLPELITELIKLKPVKPLALSLVVDTGLGGVPKAVSIVESRMELLALRMVEMPAPSDVDEVWLERVAEFVPEDAIRVIEPRRGGPEWLDGVRRVADHGYWPKLRCGGTSPQAFPSVEQVADFLAIIAQSGTSFKVTTGLTDAVRQIDPQTGFAHHGFLNLLVATARALVDRTVDGENIRAALSNEDGAVLVDEVSTWSDDQARAVRGVFASYGTRSLLDSVVELQKLGLLAAAGLKS